MDINQVMSQLDELFQSGKTQEVEPFLQKNIEEAEKEEAWDAMLVLYNETIGFYRETGQYEKSIDYCNKAMELMSRMGLQNTIPYATTLLNIANAHRAAGLLQESLDYYNRVLPIYDRLLEKDDMYYASLYNNISLLYQEMGEFKKAKDNLMKALEIVVQKPDTEFEIAVTHANLANTCIELGESDEAKQHALEGIKIFEDINVDDAHYSAALSALGSLYFKEGSYKKAREAMEKSRECVAKYLGKDNIQYERLTENIELIKSKEKEIQAADASDNSVIKTGLELCRNYYETYGKPMIKEKFPEYEGKIAVGLVGKGSDCFGFDDEYSRDHDFGPRFVMWVTKDTYDKIGEELQKAYEELPKSFEGVGRIETFHGRDRAGVMVIEDFYRGLIENDLINDTSVNNWLTVPEYCLAAAVNGEVFCDEEGIFTAYRNKLKGYYPKEVWYRKIAQACALFSQNGQYNLPRMRKRGQFVSAELAKAECMKQAMQLAYLLERRYAPHDKWLYKGLEELKLKAYDNSEESTSILLSNEKALEIMSQENIAVLQKYQLHDISVISLIKRLCMLSVYEKDAEEMTAVIEILAVLFATQLERYNIVGVSNLYLDANTKEIMDKSNALIEADKCKDGRIDGLSLAIAKTEFEAFDKVHNEGGRASCQNDWLTFKVMRMSQYKTWSEDMLLMYLYEFKDNYNNGRNMIQEKYARMMESTAPEEYAKFKDSLPLISEERQQITEEIIRMQVGWMEEFAAKYPQLASNARLIHTSEDMPYDTSYETYLRGELGTYSDRMLELYGRYIVYYAQNGKNVAMDIMENTVHFYGYKTLEEACRQV